MKTIKKILVSFLLMAIMVSCEDFVQIDPPRTDLIRATVFENDITADAAMINVYSQMAASGFASGGAISITFFTSLSADEVLDQTNVDDFREFNGNNLSDRNAQLLEMWSSMYGTIYNANSVLEGIETSSNVTDELKKQLEGEAKFLRAFCHFYLVNLFGDVPLVLSTDYRINAELPRTPKTEIYAQMIADLKDAQTLLPTDYSHSSNLRVRVNKGAATAMLSRIYLFSNDWTNAEVEASKVIEDETLYSLEPDLRLIFRKTSKEPIFQLWSESFPKEATNLYILPDGTAYTGSLRPEFVNSFDSEDQRWILYKEEVVVNGTSYFGSFKYSDYSTPPEDYSTVIRIAELYLIRSEARAKQQNLLGANSAESDLNIIRGRAGLPDTDAISEEDILSAILNERKWELYSEWGHRWLDLKRTEKVNQVMSIVKGSNWSSTDALYPIPEQQIINGPAMEGQQNPGY